MKPAKDWRPITPAKVCEWLESLERGNAQTEFLEQLVESHRELYEFAHGPEPPAAGQLPLFGG